MIRQDVVVVLRHRFANSTTTTIGGGEDDADAVVYDMRDFRRLVFAEIGAIASHAGYPAGSCPRSTGQRSSKDRHSQPSLRNNVIDKVGRVWLNLNTQSPIAPKRTALDNVKIIESQWPTAAGDITDASGVWTLSSAKP